MSRGLTARIFALLVPTHFCHIDNRMQPVAAHDGTARELGHAPLESHLRAIQRFSIVIPVHNGADVIADCLTSIFASVVDVPYDVIVVDDGSTDATAIAVARFP